MLVMTSKNTGVSDRSQESVGRRKTEVSSQQCNLPCHGERSAASQGNVLDHFALLVMTSKTIGVRSRESGISRKTEVSSQQCNLPCLGERSVAIQGNVLDHFALLVMTVKTQEPDARNHRD